MKKHCCIFAFFFLIFSPPFLLAHSPLRFDPVSQVPDTALIYAPRTDSLEAAVFSAAQDGNFLSKSRDIRTEVISETGLCKMACCSLAESFENSASVTVGYSDAVTGARQIRLLGQSGVYTQMLDENRPVMRGLCAPWGLSFVPGQWLQSIQIAKGVTSVINGVESLTGQINMEHRKPTDEKPLFVQASIMSDTKTDLNLASSLQLDPQSKWSTVLLAHVDGNFKTMDHNGDTFMDDPGSLNLSFSNRWLYFDPDGMQVRFGVSGVRDERTGGQLDPDGWRSDILNRSIDVYLKAGLPLDPSNDRSLALVTDYNYQNLGGSFGLKGYDARQHSVFANLIFQDHSFDSHHYSLGLSVMEDFIDERFTMEAAVAEKRFLLLDETAVGRLSDVGLYGEYTFRPGENLSVITGLRGDWYNGDGFRFSPRITARWTPCEDLVLRVNGGRGIRRSTPLVDNIGVLSTGKLLSGGYLNHVLEDSWTLGGNATWYLPWWKTSFSLDYFHTGFTEQLLIDYDCPGAIGFYLLSGLDCGLSRTDNVQVDLSSSPLKGLCLTLTGRYTDARQTLISHTDAVKPMTSRFKAVFNAQYATRLNKWIFDFTASLNGPCRVWDFMREFYPDGSTPTYPLLYAQLTRRFKGFDIYAGGENLTGYTQKNPIIGADDPFGNDFDASCVWGPLMGARFYAGIRLTIWKKGN